MDETRLGQVRDFILEARKQGQTYDQIRAQLLSSGWSDADVNEYLPTAWQQAEALSAPPAAAPPAAAPATPPAEAPAVAPVTQPPATTPAYAPPVQPVAQPPVTPPVQPPAGAPYSPATPPATIPGYAAPDYSPAVPAEYGIGAWLSRGWAMFSSDMGTLIGATLVAGLLSCTVICAPPMMVGLQRMMLKKHDGQPIAFGDLFEGFQYFGSAWIVFLAMVVASMIISAPIGFIFGHAGGSGHGASGAVMLGNGISWVWGIIVSTFLLFAMPYVADNRGGGMEAITASIEAAKSDFIIYALMVLVTQILAYVGLIACVVGVLFTAPWATASLVAVYRSRFPAGKVA